MVLFFLIHLNRYSFDFNRNIIEHYLAKMNLITNLNVIADLDFNVERVFSSYFKLIVGKFCNFSTPSL